MAATRDRRVNAGSKMSRLLEDDDEDDFYKTTYGGFNEEEEDKDYESEDLPSDTVDSDFDIDEHDEARSDVENGDEPKRKKRGIDTKAYKEPISKEPPKEKTVVKKKPKLDKSPVQIYHFTERKSKRQSTQMKTEQAARNQKEREHKMKMMREIASRKNVSSVRRLTQAELLKEAKHTEKLNQQSLEDFRKLELEKKKTRVTKQVYRGPVIRYHSVTMPVVEELYAEPEINVEGESSVELPRKCEEVKCVTKCSRTFITFTDDAIYQDLFAKKREKYAPKQICPITRQPAKYFDPITQTPYATLHAFRCIRVAYAQQLESAKIRKKEKSPVTMLETPSVSVSS
ncbi:vacuolar protein sorting-associated protein 72 homolog [Gigantopelta aegis]|uniref:vacuolar protein sorting-associated protein 72 homolog n=1 Tax=Gigantopelta aegis TaxID=1735272 RepID=UPI001B887ABE|nr:vacuolar protein sorting-associated protein 72 homolog [Gigantopelta aegis]